MSEIDEKEEVNPVLRQTVSHQEGAGKLEENSDILRLPKNRSTGDLLLGKRKSEEDGKSHVSFDTGAVVAPGLGSKATAMHEQEHGLGVSGLRRIRQQPVSRVPSHPSSPSFSFTLPPRSSSMTLGISSSKGFASTSPSSPPLHFSEDLSRFPSESLHSFSFAHQSEDALHSRQGVLKRAIEFVRDRLGFGVHHPGVVTAQAKVSGDTEIEGMVDLLLRADLLGKAHNENQHSQQLHGALTGPADFEGNVFDKAFLPHSQPLGPLRNRSSRESEGHHADNEPSRPGSSQPEPSLNSDTSAQEPTEPLSPSAVSPLSVPLPFSPEKAGMKRTYTDLSFLTLQTKLIEALAKPYRAGDHIHDGLLPSASVHPPSNSLLTGVQTPSLVHGHNNRWVPATQAVFTTEASSPWTILAANDLACLVFGVTKSEVKRLSMLEVVREDRRLWLEEKLQSPGSEAMAKERQPRSKSARVSPKPSTSPAMGGGVTAQLLSKPPWRQQRAMSDDFKKNTAKGGPNHSANKSRGVLLCGDIVPIQKRNGATGAASLWVKEKRGGLIWVLEEIAEDLVLLRLDKNAQVREAFGSVEIIWGKADIPRGTELQRLIPKIPQRIGSSSMERIGFESKGAVQYLAAKSQSGVNIPVSLSMEPDLETLRISSFPHIAGIMVLSASTLRIVSSNSVFSAALFGQPDPTGQKITQLVPQFQKIIDILVEEDNIILVDGLVIPEHSFRKARALLAVREGNADTSAIFLRPSGLIARHADGSEINVDVQMRVVRSDRALTDESIIEEKSEDEAISSEADCVVGDSEIVYALWITYARQLHTASAHESSTTRELSRIGTPRHQPSPGQASRSESPQPIEQEDSHPDTLPVTSLSQQIKEAASQPISGSPRRHSATDSIKVVSSTKEKDLHKKKKKITDFVVLEDIGQGAYGQVKLARYATPNGKKVVLKYVTKRRILVDTWIRDRRRLGTVPLEIHVLDHLRKEELRHPNIVEMTDFFEDDINYYIEMVPHGLPGMDLFDYIEMRTTMDESECRDIFLQVADALHHLHTKALVVHRDIKDENIILDGEGKVKLIDFGSAAYIKNGPFDVFVGTIDYAAPEVLQGKSYRGKEQDIWALGILLYTLVYKENPFYSIDEILDHELRTPWIMSDANLALIKAMLNRDVDQRLTITQVREHEWCRDGADGN